MNQKTSNLFYFEKISAGNKCNQAFYYFINAFSPRPAKTGHFVILLCLTPDNITC